MVRRSMAVMVLMAATVAAVAGCQGWRQAIRTPGHDSSPSLGKSKGLSEVSAVDGDPSKILAVDSDPKRPKPFFQNSRRSGGLSSEAREIEGHLGVGP